MSDKHQDSHKDVNRFGCETTTSIPDDAPLKRNPGHKLRTSNVIVNRAALTNEQQQIDSYQLDKMTGQKIQFYQSGSQVGVVRLSEGEEPTSAPNQFTGPSYRNPPQRFRFDGHKMMHHLDRLQAWQKGERFAPIHIDMGLTKFCNTACIYCYAVVQNMTQGTMIARDALLNYIDDCGRLGVRSLGFIGDGEPTLNPALYDAVVRAKQLGIDTSMATNGLELDMSRAHELLANMSWIRFNLSAGDRDGFRRVHQSKEHNFDLLVDKIRELVRIKKENNYPCTLGLQMVLIPECFDQVLKEAQLGAELGVDYFVIKHCSDSEYKEIGIQYEDYLTIGDVLKEAEGYSTADYVVQAKWNKINAAS